MTLWSVAAAQSASVAGDVEENIAHHLKLIDFAAIHHVDYLIFPELSLTGYELSLSETLALSAGDTRLTCFAEAARQHAMTISLGLPLQQQKQVLLASLSFTPDGKCSIYGKRHLHGEEKRYFSPGETAGISGEAPRKIAQVICADINEAHFASEAATAGADLYAASVLVSEQGYAYDYQLLETWASRYHIPVLMSNHARPSGGLISAAQSCFWDANGNRVIQAGKDECVMIARRTGAQWQGECHTFTPV